MTATMMKALAAVLVTSATTAATAQISLYEGERFGGRNYSSDHSVSNLAQAGFNDRAASVVVRGGNWQICSDAFFRGTCVTLGPGEYPTLRPMRLEGTISSVRELGWTPDGRGGFEGPGGPPPPGPDRRPPPPDRMGGRENWGAGGRAVLYEGRDLRGRAIAVDPAGVANLDRSGFNDRAESLRVEGGYWIFCSDANFRGECRTFAPGDYPSLPGGLGGQISSGRRVSNDYPYRQGPNWDR